MVTSAIGRPFSHPATQRSDGPQMDRIIHFFCGQTPWFFICWVAPNQSPMLLIVTHPNDHENIKSYSTSMNYMCTMQHTTVNPLSKYIWNPRQLISCQNPSDVQKLDSDLHLWYTIWQNFIFLHLKIKTVIFSKKLAHIWCRLHSTTFQKTVIMLSRIRIRT